MSKLLDLPNEIFSDNILLFLEYTDLKSLMLVSKEFELIFEWQEVWEILVMRKFGGREKVSRVVDFFVPHEKNNWKEIFKILSEVTKEMKMESVHYERIYELDVNDPEDLNYFFNVFPHFLSTAVEKRLQSVSQSQFVDAIVSIEQLILQEKNNHGYGRYIGCFKHFKFHGKGVIYYSSGGKYDGDWKDDKKHGKGVYYCSNGNKYDGNWKDGKRHGKGVLCFSDGVKYDGDWKDDKRHGKGIIYYSSGDKYDGDWNDGKIHGNGVYYYTNGCRYDGEWKDNEKHGKGVFCDSDGNKYKGGFKDGSRDGIPGVFNFYKPPFSVEGVDKVKVNGEGRFYGEFCGKVVNDSGIVVASGTWIDGVNPTFRRSDSKKIFDELKRNEYVFSRRWIKDKNEEKENEGK